MVHLVHTSWTVPESLRWRSRCYRDCTDPSDLANNHHLHHPTLTHQSCHGHRFLLSLTDTDVLHHSNYQKQQHATALTIFNSPEMVATRKEKKTNN